MNIKSTTNTKPVPAAALVISTPVRGSPGWYAQQAGRIAPELVRLVPIAVVDFYPVRGAKG